MAPRLKLDVFILIPGLVPVKALVIVAILALDVAVALIPAKEPPTQFVAVYHAVLAFAPHVALTFCANAEAEISVNKKAKNEG
jgi:hypothetical protein